MPSRRRIVAPVAGLLLAVAAAGLSSCTDDPAGSEPISSEPVSGEPVSGETSSTTAGPTASEPNATVERVVDGDTLVALIDGRRERVRLLGIDTPESVAENRPDQCYGAESSAHLTALLPAGTDITLILDEEARDQYDRLLAYVVRSSDDLFVNLDLLEQGFAAVLIYEPNDHYEALFREAERDAIEQGTGLWGVCGGPDVPLE